MGRVRVFVEMIRLIVLCCSRVSFGVGFRVDVGFVSVVSGFVSDVSGFVSACVAVSTFVSINRHRPTLKPTLNLLSLMGPRGTSRSIKVCPVNPQNFDK